MFSQLVTSFSLIDGVDKRPVCVCRTAAVVDPCSRVNADVNADVDVNVDVNADVDVDVDVDLLLLCCCAAVLLCCCCACSELPQVPQSGRVRGNV